MKKMDNDTKGSVKSIDKTAIAKVLFLRMRDWLNANRDFYLFFTPHDKMVMDAKTYNDLSYLDKKILEQEVEFRLNGLPYCKEGLNAFTIRKEEMIFEIIDSLR